MRRWDAEGPGRRRPRRPRRRSPAGENLTGLEQFRPLLAAGALDIVQTGAVWGVTHFLRVAALAHAHDLPVSPIGTTPIGLLHAATAVPNHIASELQDLRPPTGLSLDLHIEDGAFVLGDTPGLGMPSTRRRSPRPADSTPPRRTAPTSGRRAPDGGWTSSLASDRQQPRPWPEADRARLRRCAARQPVPAITDDEAGDSGGRAWDAGVRYFDTAPHYGLGLSERRLGQALRALPATSSSCRPRWAAGWSRAEERRPRIRRGSRSPRPTPGLGLQPRRGAPVGRGQPRAPGPRPHRPRPHPRPGRPAGRPSRRRRRRCPSCAPTESSAATVRA